MAHVTAYPYRRVRKNLTVYLEAQDADGNELARIINLSTGGALILHTERLEQDSVIETVVRLPRVLEHLGPLELTLHVRWCQDEPDNDYFTSGCEFVNITAGALKLVSDVVERFSFDGGSIFDWEDSEGVVSRRAWRGWRRINP